jgi:hypothetical protein
MECCLGKGEVMRISGGETGIVLRSRRGTLWITTGEAADYLIHEGRCLEVAAGASALVEALGSAEMQIELPARSSREAGSLILQRV